MREDCKRILVSKLTEYVRMNGTDVTDCERDEFGIYDEDGCHVTKILNFFESDGCVIATQNLINLPDINIGGSNEELLRQLAYNFSVSAYLCLYIEVDEKGREYLKYYRLYNSGVCFTSDFAEPDHEYVLNLGLNEIDAIINVINKFD